MNTIIFLDFDRFIIEIKTSDKRILKLVKLLFPKFICEKPNKINSRYYIFRDNNSNYSIVIDNILILCEANLATISSYLEWNLTKEFIDNITRYIIIHAALLSYKNRYFLFPAKSGEGKTTLSIILSHKGFKYHTDELCLISNKNEIITIPRGLSLRKNGYNFVSKGIKNLNFQKIIFKHNQFYYLAPENIENTSIRKIDFIIYPCKAKVNEIIKLSKFDTINKMFNFAYLLDNKNSENLFNLFDLIIKAQGFQFNISDPFQIYNILKRLMYKMCQANFPIF